MSSIKDIEYMMKGEPTPVQKKEEEYIPEAVVRKGEAKVNSEFVVFKLVNSNRKGGVHIPAIDYVIDPRTVTKEKPNGNGPEMIRLLNGITTIWAKEQKELTPEYIKKNLRSIEWPRGTRFISIPAWDVAMLEFMRRCRHNIKNEFRTTGSKTEFFEYDPTEVAKARLSKELLEIEMVTKAKEQSFEKMKKHAFFLNISLTDELGRAKEEDALKIDYMLAAKRDPERFKKTLDSQEVDVAYMVRAAIIDNKIDISKQTGKAYWSSGELICAYQGKAHEALTEYALQKTSEAKEFLERLKTIVKT
jgi:hypothetical protein